MTIPKRLGTTDSSHISFNGKTSLEAMVLIPGGEFDMGGDNSQADPDEYPKT